MAAGLFDHGWCEVDAHIAEDARRHECGEQSGGDATTTRSQRQTFEIARRLHRGEKLYEELTVVGEQHLPTRHSKIMVAKGRHHDCHNIRRAIQRLEELAEESAEVLIAELRAAIPEYQPQFDTDKRDRRRAA